MKNILTLSCWYALDSSSKPKASKVIEHYLNPVMCVFIRWLSLSTLRWVPLCQSFSHFSVFLHHVVLVNLATSNTRVEWWKVRFLNNVQILTLMLLLANLANTKWCKKTWKITKTLAWYGYSGRAFQWIPTWQGLNDFQNLCVLVLWTKVALALEGLLKDGVGDMWFVVECTLTRRKCICTFYAYQRNSSDRTP